VNGDGAYEVEMDEVALFENALRAAVRAKPDPALRATLVPRLAEIARAATLEEEGRAARRAARAPAASRRTRLVRLAQACAAVALVPLVLAGLAFAGVTVPGLARDAFDSVGITLPNQPAEHGAAPNGQGTQSTGNDVSDAAKSGANRGKGGNSAAAHRHARAQHAKAHGKAKGHTKGKAIGLNDLTPPGRSGHAPPSHSNAGGSPNGRTNSARAAPHPHPFPGSHGRGRGRSRQH